MIATEGIIPMKYRKQWMATLSVTLMSFCHGIALGWLSPMLLRLQSSDSPLDFPISNEEASWIGALICVGGLIGNLGFARLLELIGRKWALMTLVIPHMLLWVFVFFAKSVWFLYLGRMFAGMTGGGIYVVIPIFISEIADSTIRGRLTSMFSIFLNCGVLLGFIVSSHLPYHAIPPTILPITFIFLFFTSRLPETPQYLLRKGREEEAESSLKFYKNYDNATKMEKEQFKVDLQDLKEAMEKQKSNSGKIEVRDFLNKKIMKLFLTGVILMMVNIYSGQFAFMNYMSTIFSKLKTQLDPNTATIIVGVVQILGTIISASLVDHFGRKALMVSSTAGMSIGLGCLGLYAFYVEELSFDFGSYSYWVPLLLMATIIFIGNCGLVSVIIIVLVEIMPMKIRSMAASFSMAVLSILAFSLLKIYPIFLESIGLASTIWCSACVCTFAIFYISFFLEETKGKSMYRDEEISPQSQNPQQP